MTNSEFLRKLSTLSAACNYEQVREASVSLFRSLWQEQHADKQPPEDPRLSPIQGADGQPQRDLEKQLAQGSIPSSDAQLAWILLTQFNDHSLGRQCLYAGPLRGDCAHFIGIDPIGLAKSEMDQYGKPLQWCWPCWYQYRIQLLEHHLGSIAAQATMTPEFVQSQTKPAE